MVDRNKILSDLSKFAVDAMSTFSGVKEEIETIVSLRVNKIIKKMNLVKKDEFDALKKMVQKLKYLLLYPSTHHEMTFLHSKFQIDKKD